jgi:hypothetical protein
VRFSKKSSGPVYGGVIAAVGVGFLVYEILRAARVSLTIDEAETYLNFLSSRLTAVFNFGSANNHFLNTLLAKVSSLSFGNGEFALRLPNLLGYAVYLGFGFLLLNRFVCRSGVILGFLLLNLNPYVLDFFSLCRGYGLSLGFLMASLYFFSRFLSDAADGASGAEKSLGTSLIACSAAVMSNYALLDVYLCLALLAVVAFAVSNRRAAGRSAIPVPLSGTSPFRLKTATFLLILIFVFNAFVAFEDILHTGSQYAAVTVRIEGNEPDTAKAIVMGLTLDKNELPFSFEDGEWRIGEGLFLSGLRLEIPAAALAPIPSIRIQIGGETFPCGVDELTRLSVPGKDAVFDTPARVSLTKSRLGVESAAVNWKGDSRFLSRLALRLLLLAAIAVSTVLIVNAVGRFAARRRLVKPAQWRALAVPTLALAGFAAYPLALLIQRHQFYWGGDKGLIGDTWTSLLNDSFYGVRYSAGQSLAVSVLCLSIGVVFIAAAAGYLRRKRLRDLVPGALFPALLLLIALAVFARRRIFHTPFPLDRTALYFLPIAVLATVFSLYLTGREGRTARWPSLALLVILTLGAGVHFARTANTALTVEWRFDADTKRLAAELPAVRAGLDGGSASIRLGLDWHFVPSLTYYLRRRPLPWLDAKSIDIRPENDLYYLGESFDPTRMILIREYPLSGNILVRPRGKIP